ncbi:MAG: carbon-nitrogen hydrolase family protein [Bacteroidota bacterium]|nr:carbon-nitrogen hydrolase family protein [Bacteroidota bacterium]MEE3225761.1 carbon-nitrogen hydrolase family protein [Bacteroidota bacterium]
MKICLAQIAPHRGNVQKNMEIHKKWIERAIHEQADLIAFPELSLTGYEPQKSKALAFSEHDERLDLFKQLSDTYKITIAIGVPTTSKTGIHISMFIFQPQQERKLYSKQHLHVDELPFFTPGTEQLIFKVSHTTIAPAICFDSLQKEHAENAFGLGAAIYLASVAKSETGMKKAYMHYPKIAKKHAFPVACVNNIGFCDNFYGAGQSAIWNGKGDLIAALSKDQEGLLLYDFENHSIRIIEA